MIQSDELKTAVYEKKVLIDSNIIIYLTEDIEPYNSLSRELFTFIENGKTKAGISILSVSEVMQGPLRAGKIQIANEVKNYLINFPNCRCLDITYEVLERIGNDDRVNWRILRSIDRLIIASGLYAEVDLFISNDRHFKNSLPSEMLLSFN